MKEQGQNMNSHNTKTETDGGNEPVHIKSGQEEPRVLQSTLVDSSELSIADDEYDVGDPYNSTGRHVIIQSKIVPEE